MALGALAVLPLSLDKARMGAGAAGLQDLLLNAPMGERTAAVHGELKRHFPKHSGLSADAFTQTTSRKDRKNKQQL